MALADRLRHTIAIERPTWTEDRSDRTPPSVTWSVVATVRAWIQPKEVREAPSASGAGALLSSHRVYMEPTDVRHGDVLRRVPDDGHRYQVAKVVDAAGKGQHYQVDTMLVAPGGA